MPKSVGLFSTITSIGEYSHLLDMSIKLFKYALLPS